MTEWATWVLIIRHESDATANLTIAVSPGEGNELEVLYGRVLNSGAAGRTMSVFIDDGSTQIGELLPSASQGNGTVRNFPTIIDVADGNIICAGARLFLGGPMRLVASATSMLTTEEMRLTLVCRVRGSEPTVTTAESAGTATTVTTTARMV